MTKFPKTYSVLWHSDNKFLLEVLLGQFQSAFTSGLLMMTVSRSSFKVTVTASFMSEAKTEGTYLHKA